jgi:hypothetical protein
MDTSPIEFDCSLEVTGCRGCVWARHSPLPERREMTGTKREIPVFAAVAAVAVLLVAAACGPSVDETAAATATLAAPARSPGPCGDGVCDEAEQADPALCPADCAAADGGTGEVADETQPEPESAEETELEPAEETESEPAEEAEPTAAALTETKCEPSEWTIAIEARATLVNAEPSADLFATIIGGLIVNESCRIRGTSAGQYIKETCAYESITGVCSYDLQCPEFKAAISGWAVPGEEITDTFKIRLDRASIWETGSADCLGEEHEVKTGPVLQNAIGSAERNGGGYLAQIEVVDPGDDPRPFYKEFHNAAQGQDAVAPVNLWYFFSVRLYPGTRSIRFEQLWRDWEDQPDTWDLPH